VGANRTPSSPGMPNVQAPTASHLVQQGLRGRDAAFDAGLPAVLTPARDGHRTEPVTGDFAYRGGDLRPAEVQTEHDRCVHAVPPRRWTDW